MALTVSAQFLTLLWSLALCVSLLDPSRRIISEEHDVFWNLSPVQDQLSKGDVLNARQASELAEQLAEINKQKLELTANAATALADEKHAAAADLLSQGRIEALEKALRESAAKLQKSYADQRRGIGSNEKERELRLEIHELQQEKAKICGMYIGFLKQSDG
eukprot:g22868.t1